MLKQKLIQKIIVASAALFAMLLIYLVPSNDNNTINNNLEYTNEIKTHPIFLLDNNQYLGKTEIVLNSQEIEDKVKELVEILIKGGQLENRIPSGFTSILPPSTKILSIKYEENLIKIDFSKEILEIDETLEEKMIEALIYTITSIDEVNKIIIYVEGEILNKLPQTNITLPSTLDRNFGINKTFKFNKIDDINQVTVYYMNKHNENYYYVPVTKYVNDTREKIEIVIDELSSSNTYNTNLLSYVNYKTKLLAVEQQEDIMELTFNSYIFNDLDQKQILEEVIQTISLSIKDNYDVEEVIFYNEDIEILTSILTNIK